MEKSRIYTCISELLKIGAISECTPCKDQYVSKIFIVPKPNGTFRFILNLKKFNRFVQNTHFKMEDIRTAVKLIEVGHYMGSVDLKDAYFLVGINRHSRKYLRFNFENKLYQFDVLPFGLSTAPYVFTKIMRQVTTYLRSHGITIVNYLDDFLIIAPTREKCEQNIGFVCQFIQSLGFIINYEKSQLHPSKQCRFLGFNLDTNHFTINIPEDKKHTIMVMINAFCKKKICSIREFASLLGTLTSICPAVPYGWMYTKVLERCKYLALLDSDDNYEAKMKITPKIVDELSWWLKTVPTCAAPIRRENYK